MSPAVSLDRSRGKLAEREEEGRSGKIHPGGHRQGAKERSNSQRANEKTKDGRRRLLCETAGATRGLSPLVALEVNRHALARRDETGEPHQSSSQSNPLSLHPAPKLRATMPRGAL
ncbi:hypothetical protein DPEC_G00087450 [Dallia pectoralis]|uniref:Uncharacterized protein n=1 Tax=Dallia pectoralis TaxID=75939 RepID=A0ACC2GZU9_DALPE|nr:hypothetical protein DPEC_G00087450 [Dallia pectoralis]